uniref:Uncharacterized protein n=1 Tax=viral metagenome TaxID=1070528 RepID=A0A6C0KGL8_9ZZZZ
MNSVTKKINIKLNEYLETYKIDILDFCSNKNQDELKYGLKEFINNYPSISIEKDDLLKRKRTNNLVPYFDRCMAKKANNEQCTRRRKDDDKYCGTHSKGTPHGYMNIEDKNQITSEIKKISVKATEINGIVYYIDTNGNVYDTVDVYENKDNPRIISKYNYDEETDTYELI